MNKHEMVPQENKEIKQGRIGAVEKLTNERYNVWIETSYGGFYSIEIDEKIFHTTKLKVGNKILVLKKDNIIYKIEINGRVIYKKSLAIKKFINTIKQLIKSTSSS